MWCVAFALSILLAFPTLHEPEHLVPMRVCSQCPLPIRADSGDVAQLSVVPCYTTCYRGCQAVLRYCAIYSLQCCRFAQLSRESLMRV